MSGSADFDMQAAWLRRFSADAEGNLRAFALRLREAMPEQVTIEESGGLFVRTPKTTGVTVELGDKRYRLALERGRLKASLATVVRGIVLNTRQMEPSEWFARIAEETAQASAHARALSQSLAAFMGG